MRGCLLFRMRALTLYGSIVLSFCHFRTNKSPPRPRQIKSKSFLPCQRERCAATCAAHEHTELAAIPRGRKGTRRHRHERPHAPHAVRLRCPRRDWRGGQASEEVPRLLPRCAARVAAGMAQGRALSRMSKPSKILTEAKLERARRALQVIYTWATFRDGAAFHRLDVLRLVEKTLRELK
jgi:hypothetical protein